MIRIQKLLNDWKDVLGVNGNGPFFLHSYLINSLILCDATLSSHVPNYNTCQIVSNEMKEAA
jgi:hypothetical protein